MSEKRTSSAGDPNKEAPSVSGKPVTPVVQEAPPPARPDPVALIRNRLRELVSMREQRAAELERRVKAELSALDNSIAELNALLTQMGQPGLTEHPRPINMGQRIPAPRLEPQVLEGPPGSASNIRQMAQNHPLSGQNLLRKRMAEGGGGE